MNDGPLALAHRALADAVGLLAAASDTTATPDDVLFLIGDPGPSGGLAAGRDPRARDGRDQQPSPA